MAQTESNFNLMYRLVKDFVVASMQSKKFGEVVVLMEDMPTYVSASWLDQVLVKLRSELNEECGIVEVKFCEADKAKGFKAAIVIK